MLHWIVSRHPPWDRSYSILTGRHRTKDNAKKIACMHTKLQKLQPKCFAPTNTGATDHTLENIVHNAQK